MQNANLGLSAEERRLVLDPGIILTKNRIIDKVYSLFGVMADELRALPWPEGTELASPKIARGENYRGLPFVMLDFPRLFSNQHVMAVRTHFWWGNYISVVLHLKGQYQERYIGQVGDAGWRLQHYWVASSDDEWEYAMVEPFWKPIKGMDADAFREHIGIHSFLKIGRKFPLETEDMGKSLIDTYTMLSDVLQPSTSNLQPGD
ncbi:MAG: hypothetical protein WBP58_12235 [Chitinophagaceae bacterium]